MKKIVFILLCLLSCISSYTQDENSKFTVSQIDSLQLSASDLANLTTEEIFQSCMSYPYLINFFAYGGDLKAFEAMAEEYNGFKELFKRDDCVNVLLNEYKALPSRIENVKKIVNKESKGILSINTLILEFALSEAFTLGKMKDSNFNNFISIASTNIKAMNESKDIFSKIHAFPINSIVASCQLSETKKAQTERLLTSYVKYESIPLTTLNGTPILSALEFVGIDYNESEKASIIQLFMDAYSIPIDSIVGEPTYTYNCHAYAWHMSQGGNAVWINGKDDSQPNGYYLSPYWNGGGFTTTTSSDAGYQQVLYAGDHSAINMGNGAYISKWGSGPVIKHAPNNVPPGYLPSQTKQYFKRCFEISGSDIIYNNGSYHVNHLTPNFSVNWSLIGSNSSDFYIQTDSINANACILTRKDITHLTNSYDLSLVAIVKRNNDTVYIANKALTTPYIDGPALTCSYSTYEVNPIYQNQTVEWSFSGIGGGTLVLGNTRSFQVPENACGIVNTDNRVIRGTLTATVKSGNDVVGTLKKKVGTGVNFAGTWYQQASLHDTLNATPKDFEDGDFLDIVSGRKVYLQSAGFIGATITHTNSGMSTLGWTNNNGVISFTPVCNGNSGSITINATKGSCQKFTLRLRTGFSILDPILNTAPTLDIEETGRDYTFTLVPEGGKRNDELQQWNLSIVQYETGKTVHNSTITRTSVSVNTTAWQPGIYIVTATVGDKKIAKKIIIGG